MCYDAPKPPDPIKTGSAQTATNIGTAVAGQFLNNQDQYTPEGSLTYSQTGTYQFVDPVSGKSYDIPTFASTQTYSPEQQALYDTTTETKQNLAEASRDQAAFVKDYLGQSVDPSGLNAQQSSYGSAGQYQTNAPTPGALMTSFGDAGQLQRNIAGAGNIQRTYDGADDFSADRQRYEQALMERMNEYLDRDQQALNQQLANQGLRYGTEAFNRAQYDQSRRVNDARLSAILGAGDEQARMVGMARDAAGFNNAAQQQQFAQNFDQANFANTAQQAQFAQNLERAGFSNAATQQMYQNALQQMQARNAAIGMQNQDYAQRAAFNNAARTQGMQELFSLRNQPINEISALMSGSQVSQPNWIGQSGAQIPTTDYAGLLMNNYNQQLAASQAENASMGNLFGGLFKLGGAAAFSPVAPFSWA